MPDILGEKLIARAIAANARRRCRESQLADTEHLKLIRESLSRSREVLSVNPSDAFAGRKTPELSRS
jgi:hypothetical protein